MEKPALMTLGAVFVYALYNVLLEQKFRGVNTLVLMIVMYSVMLFLSTMTLFVRGHTGNPIGVNWPFAIGAGMLLFCSSYLVTSAYASGGTVFVISMIMVSTPVIASGVRYLWVGGLPTGQQVLGYLLATLSVYLIITGRPKPV